jgi:hypothetical protein
MTRQFQFPVCLLSAILALPASAYVSSLSAQEIREAYFLGARQGSLGPSFLAMYNRRIPELKAGTCTSQARVETPFLQVADYASKSVNYSAQEAVKDFYGKPLVFQMYLNICYAAQASAPHSIRIQVSQNKKEIIPLSDKRSPYAEPADDGSYFPNNGEQAKLEFASNKLDSSTLTIRIDTPDGQRGSAEFDLQTIR